jgi:general secretion pathway protein I
MRRGSAGFTLIEVMVAIAILALSLSAIFASEAGAIKMAHRSRKMGIATLLVRCKMGEVEEKIANMGFPAVYDSGTDNCCEDSPSEGFNCDWEVDPILLPDTMFMTGDPNKDPKNPNATQGSNTINGQSTSALAAQGALAAQQGATGTAPPAFGAAPGAFGATPGAMPGMPGATGAPGSDPMSMMRGMDPATMLSGGGMGGIASMAMGMIYPMLKPAFESQIRRATVTIRWKEGSVEHSFDVTQYLVADQPVQLTPEQAQQLGQQLQQQNGIAPGPGSMGAVPPATPGIGR